MPLKLKRRKSIIWNMLVFMPLSLLFYHVVLSLSKNLSALDSELLRGHLIDKWHVTALAALAALSVFFVKKSSRIFVFLFLAVSGLETARVLTHSYNKIILIMLLFFLAIVYHMYLMWIFELEDPIYNPMIFERSDWEFSPKFKIGARVKTTSGNECTGLLTNWNELSCFVKLAEPISMDSDKILLMIEFKGKSFENEGEIMTQEKDGLGLGIRLRPPNDHFSFAFNWTDFYVVLCEQGLFPEYVI